MLLKLTYVSCLMDLRLLVVGMGNTASIPYQACAMPTKTRKACIQELPCVCVCYLVNVYLLQ